MELYKKLLGIQKEIEHFIKDKSGHNYKYTTGNQVLSKIRPLMNENGLLLKQEILTISNTPITYKTKYGEKMEILTCTTQKFTWIDSETGEKDEILFAGNGFNDFDKGLGSALTYSERYFLLKYFHVPTDELDPDKRQSYNKGVAKKETPTSEKNRLPNLTEAQYNACLDATPEQIKTVLKTYRMSPQQRETLTDKLK